MDRYGGDEKTPLHNGRDDWPVNAGDRVVGLTEKERTAWKAANKASSALPTPATPSRKRKRSADDDDAVSALIEADLG
jgi:hypothetical protein